MNVGTAAQLDRALIGEHPTLCAVWELVPKAHEVYHGGRWLLVEEIQPTALNGPDQDREVYLVLEGPLVVRQASTIDRTSGVIETFTFVVREGPVLIRAVSTLIRARLRSDS